jgi:hypothetical protein
MSNINKPPVLGAIAKVGPPTSEQAFAAGLKQGREGRECWERKGSS